MTEDLKVGYLVDCGAYGRGYVRNPRAAGRMVLLTESQDLNSTTWYVNEEHIQFIIHR